MAEGYHAVKYEDGDEYRGSLISSLISFPREHTHTQLTSIINLYPPSSHCGLRTPHLTNVLPSAPCARVVFADVTLFCHVHSRGAGQWNGEGKRHGLGVVSLRLGDAPLLTLNAAPNVPPSPPHPLLNPS
jgi:hypothetical protein